MNYRPLGDRVLIRPKETEEKTASGIVLPDTAKENHRKGNNRCRSRAKDENGNRIQWMLRKETRYLFKIFWHRS